MKIPDASLAVKWVAPEDDSNHAEALFADWTRRGEELVAPYLLPVEITNILRQKMRRDGRSQAFVKSALDQFLSLPITLLPSSRQSAARLHHDALDIAVRFDLPATYDAHYVALAMSLDCELWTADERLINQLAGRIPNVRPFRGFIAS